MFYNAVFEMYFVLVSKIKKYLKKNFEFDVTLTNF